MSQPSDSWIPGFIAGFIPGLILGGRPGRLRFIQMKRSEAKVCGENAKEAKRSKARVSAKRTGQRRGDGLCQSNREQGGETVTRKKGK